MPGVYILLDPQSQLLKIGRATNFETRLANLRTANPRLVLVEWFETSDDSLVESYVHAKLVHFRKEGEFFCVSSETAIAHVREILSLLAQRPDASVVAKIKASEDLVTARAPSSDELELVKAIIGIRAAIKTLETEELILSERLMHCVGDARGLLGWATFDGSTTNRFDGTRFQSEHPELAQQYQKSTYTRSLRIRPGMANDTD